MAHSKQKSLKRILVIAEKPIQGAEIAGAILDVASERRTLPQGGIIGKRGDREVLVAWAEGHLFEAVRPDEIRAEWGSPWNTKVLPLVPDNLTIPLRPRSGAGPRLNILAGWINEAAEVVNACDAGPEGELIFDEIVRYANLDQDADKGPVAFSRMWITDTRSQALLSAFIDRDRANLVRYKRQREAAHARSDADWLLGFNGTRYATCALGSPELPLLVIGRVQTPTLGDVVSTDRKILTFVPERFDYAPVSFRGETGAMFEARLVAFPDIRHGNVDHHFHPGPEVRNIREQLLHTKEIPWKITDMSEPRLEYAPPPFDLIDLQRSAFNLYRWPATKTLKVAQSLYAREKAITYPRTDCCKVPSGMREEVETVREKLYYGWALDRFPELKGAILPTEDVHWDDSPTADHYAILPTGTIPQAWTNDGEMRDEYTLWQLIAVRTILAWLPSATIAAVKRLMMRPWGQEQVIRAFVEAEPVDDPGWLWWESKMSNTRGYGKPLHERMREVALPEGGRFAKMLGLDIKSGQTAPPKHHDESSLLGWMKRHNLGTAATRAQVIEDIIHYGYIVRTSVGQIRATIEGARMVELLEERVGEDLTGTAGARQLEEFIERIGGMAKDRPTRARLWDTALSRIATIGAKLLQQNDVDDVAFCPRTGFRAELDKSGKAYTFVGYKDARFWLTVGNRKMKASEYALVLAGGDRGAGPFKGFKSRTGNTFDACLVWRPRKKKIEYLFKR